MSDNSVYVLKKKTLCHLSFSHIEKFHMLEVYFACGKIVQQF